MTKKNIFNCIGFLLVTAVLIALLQPVFVPKWEDGLATTTVVDGFYAEKKNSLDAVVFGTSHTVMGCAPMELYRDYGIKAYTLGTGNQSLSATAAWVKEAYRYQKNMTAVVDVYGLVYPYYSTDAALHEGVDYMRPSLDKAVAILRGCMPEHRELVRYFVPLTEYHSRYKELNARDVLYGFEDHRNSRKGYYPLEGRVPEADYHGVETEGAVPDADAFAMDEGVCALNISCLDDITAFCRKNQIPLLLVKFPSTEWTAEESLMVEALAEERGLDFLDMNRSPYYSAGGFLCKEDFQSPDHLNVEGAKKATRLLGDYLIEQGYVSPGKEEAEDPLWAADVAAYETYINGVRLGVENDFETICTALEQQKDYLVFYAYQDNQDPAFSMAYADMMERFGLPGAAVSERASCFFGVQQTGRTFCREEAQGALSGSGTISRDVCADLSAPVSYTYEVRPEGASLQINGEEWTVPGANGLHLIVYSVSRKTVICADCITPVAQDIYWCVRR